MSPINDIEIINRVLEGDKSAFAEIIKKYQNMVFRYVYYQFGNYDEALDITQDIFITYDPSDGEPLCAFTSKIHAESDATESGCGVKTISLVCDSDLIADVEKLKQEKDELIKTLEMINSIHNGCFTEDFNVVDLKRKLNRLIQKHKKGD